MVCSVVGSGMAKKRSLAEQIAGRTRRLARFVEVSRRNLEGMVTHGPCRGHGCEACDFMGSVKAPTVDPVRRRPE